VNIFETTVSVVIGDEITLTFGTPNAKQMADALSLAKRLQDAKTEGDFQGLTYAELPELLAGLVRSALIKGSSDLPVDWQEQLKDTPYLSGPTGLEIMQAVCFRSRLATPGAGA